MSSHDQPDPEVKNRYDSLVREIIDNLRNRGFGGRTSSEEDCQEAAAEGLASAVMAGIIHGSSRFADDLDVTSRKEILRLSRNALDRERRSRIRLSVADPTWVGRTITHDPIGLIIGSLTIAEVLESLEGLTQLVANLYYIDGIHIDDITEVVGLPSSTVYRHLKTVRNAILEALSRT